MNVNPYAYKVGNEKLRNSEGFDEINITIESCFLALIMHKFPSNLDTLHIRNSCGSIEFF